MNRVIQPLTDHTITGPILKPSAVRPGSEPQVSNKPARPGTLDTRVSLRTGRYPPQPHPSLFHECSGTPMNVISLGAWLDACNARSIDTVPANLIGALPVEAVFAAAGGERSHDMDRLFVTAMKHRGHEMILRWDCCAPSSIKIAMARPGGAWTASMLDISPDDPRLLFTLNEFPESEIRLWARPWVQAVVHDGYPIEFRVFVEGGRIQGVSSYYPQRPLAGLFYKAAAQACAKRTETLLDVAPAFTADWLLTPSNDLLFLEGGPSHQSGAHPCCFARGEIDGIALSARLAAPRQPPQPPERPALRPPRINSLRPRESAAAFGL